MTTSRAGETILLIEVPRAQTLVRTAEVGIPAHVTVLYPFLPDERIDRVVLADLAELVRENKAFAIGFESCGQFPGVLYLEPSPAAKIRALTELVSARWPDFPPYEGKYADITPHLTVVYAKNQAELTQVEEVVRSSLPITSHVDAVSLWVHDGMRWQPHTKFPLGA
jgi:2'-5' RNA ligase